MQKHGTPKNPGKNLHILMKNFKFWLERSENKIDLNFEYINPDDLYHTPSTEAPFYPEGGFTFIYGKVPKQWHDIIYPEENKLYTASRYVSHRDLREQLEEDTGGFGWGYLQGINGRCAKIKIAARANYNERIFLISVWGIDNELIGPCIQAIRREIGDVGVPIVLSSSKGNKLIDSGRSNWHGSATSAEDMEKLRQLHLMNSPEKLAARKKLGLWSMKKRPDAEYRVLQPEHRE